MKSFALTNVSDNWLGTKRKDNCRIKSVNKCSKAVVGSAYGVYTSGHHVNSGT